MNPLTAAGVSNSARGSLPSQYPSCQQLIAATIDKVLAREFKKLKSSCMAPSCPVDKMANKLDAAV
jgi:hypothetical protein